MLLKKTVSRDISFARFFCFMQMQTFFFFKIRSIGKDTGWKKMFAKLKNYVPYFSSSQLLAWLFILWNFALKNCLQCYVIILPSAFNLDLITFVTLVILSATTCCVFITLKSSKKFFLVLIIDVVIERCNNYLLRLWRDRIAFRGQHSSLVHSKIFIGYKHSVKSITWPTTVPLPALCLNRVGWRPRDVKK